MHVEIKPWGHSASVRIPKRVMEAAGFRMNDVFEISASGNQLVLTRVGPHEGDAAEEARLLAMLIAGAPAERYDELAMGEAVGREIL